MQIILSHISKSYDNKPVLRDVTLTIGAGEAIVLTGPSGIGKTTLLRILTGREAPDAGTVQVLRGQEMPDAGTVQNLAGQAGQEAIGKSVTMQQPGGKKQERARAFKSGTGFGTASLARPEALHIGMDFQEDRLVEDLSAVENVLLVHVIAENGENKSHGQRRRRRGRMEQEKRIVREELSVLLPADALDKPASELSGGMRRRVCLVRAMILPKDIYVLDEPFAGLDIAARDKCIQYIRQRRRQSPVILSAHERQGLQWMREFSLA